MIHSIHGEVIEGTSSGVLVVVGPLTMELVCSDRDSHSLLESIGQGQRLVYTHLEVTEEQALLIGFHTPEAKALYKALLGVSGIGRTRALAILNAGEPRDILRAVLEKETKILLALPKIGPKNVQAVIQNLNKQWTGAAPRPLPVKLDEWIQARDVLVGKGLSVDEAEQRLFDELENA